MLQLDPPGQCHPEVHPKYLLSTQKWDRKKQKRSKTAKSSQKGDFARQNSPLRKWFLRLFSCPSSQLIRAGRLAPPYFDRGLKMRISSDDRQSIKKWSFTVRKIEISFYKGPNFSVQKNPFFNFLDCKWSFLIARGSSLEIFVLGPRSKGGGAKRPARTGREDGRKKNSKIFFQRAEV